MGLRMTGRIALTLAAGLALAPLAAGAADWPTGPVQMVIPSRPGGGTDIMGRIVAEYLQRTIGKPVVVIDQPAGGGAVAFEQVRTARPDGLTLLFNHTGILVNMHTGKYNHGLDAFTTIAIAQSYPPQVFAVSPKSSWQSLGDFVADATAHPGQRTVGVSLGGSTHFIAGALMQATGVKLRLVEASAEVDKVAGIQGGNIDIGNLGVGSAEQYQQAGQMRILCMIDPVHSAKFPEVKTCQETGVDVTWLSPLVIWGPAGMGPSIVAAINAAVAGMADDPEVKKQLAAADSAFTPRSVAEAQALIAGEDAKIADLAGRLGLSN